MLSNIKVVKFVKKKGLKFFEKMLKQKGFVICSFICVVYKHLNIVHCKTRFSSKFVRKVKMPTLFTFLNKKQQLSLERDITSLHIFL